MMSSVGIIMIHPTLIEEPSGIIDWYSILVPCHFLSFALGYAAINLNRAPLTCSRQIVDVSGDGVNNEGYAPELAYKNFAFEGVQVNGLVIDGADPDPVAYFREKVIYGPGAFVEVAENFADYEAAMRRKLLREINGAALSLAR